MVVKRLRVVPLDHYLGDKIFDYCDDCRNYSELTFWNGSYLCKNCSGHELNYDSIKVLKPCKTDVKNVSRNKNIILTICYAARKKSIHSIDPININLSHIPTKNRLKEITKLFYQKLYNKKRFSINLFEIALADLINNDLIFEKRSKLKFYGCKKAYNAYYYYITKKGVNKYRNISNLNPEISLIYLTVLENRWKVINTECGIKDIILYLDISYNKYIGKIKRIKEPSLKVRMT